MATLPAVKSRRERAAKWASRSGLTAAVEALPRRPGLLVLTYHRIGAAQGCDYDDAVFEATPEQFEEQVRYLKSYFHIAELAEVIQWAQGSARLRHSHVLITFDDGYVDNYEIAFRILKAYGVPATFFLPTSLIGTQQVPWWDQIAFLLRNAAKPKIVIEYPRHMEIDLKETGLESSIRKLLAFYKGPEVEPTKFLGALERSCGVQLPQQAARRLFMTWDEAAEMLRGGMSIGSHTHSHRILAKLTAEEQREELARSRDALREQLGIRVTALAYPVGSPAAFNADSRQALRDHGYNVAFSNYGGVNYPGQIKPDDIRRVGMHRELSIERFRLRTQLAAAMNTVF